MTNAEQGLHQQARRLIVLVGLEGSGKSSLAAALAQNGWAVVAQGTSADRASQHCQKLLRQGREVVVDRCNIRADDRSFYSRLQQQSSAIFVASCTLHLAAHVCAARALQKDSIQDHEQVLARICRCVPSRALSRFSGLFLCRHAASAGHTKAIQLALQRLGVCYGLDLQLLGFQLPWLLKEQCNKAQRAPAAIAIINGSYACRQQEEYQPVLQGPEGFAIVYDMHRQADIDAFVAQMGPASPAYATRNTEQPSLPQGPRRPQAAASHALQVSHAAAASQPGPSIGRQHWQQQPVNSADHDVNVSFQWADYSAPQQVHAQAQRRNWWDQAGSSIQPSDSPRSAATHQSVGRLQTSQAVPVQPPSMQHISVRPQMHHPAELFQKPSKSLADSHPDSHCQSAPHALPSSTCSAIQAASQPAAIAIVTAMQQHPPLLQVLPTRHPFGGGPLLPSACPGSPGTASSPAPAASRQHSNLQLLQTASSPSSQPSPASKKAKHKKQQAGSVAIPAASANAHSGGDGARAPSCAAEIAAASRLPVNNIVPGPQGIDGSQWQQFTHTFQPPRLPIDEMDPRPIILFDLNGTLTQHTAVRNSTGNTMLRPGIEHLVKLQAHFRLGIFSSASQRTVRMVIPMLQAAAGESGQEPLFCDASLVFHRSQTLLAPPSHREAGGKAWDTVKPLYKLFRKLHRVLLVDDDAFKAVEGEAANMVLVPCWEHNDHQDICIAALVDALLDGPENSSETDLRQVSAAISEKVQEACGACAHSADTAPTGLPEARVVLAVGQDMLTNIMDVEENGKQLDVDAYVAGSSSDNEEGQLAVAVV